MEAKFAKYELQAYKEINDPLEWRCENCRYVECRLTGFSFYLTLSGIILFIKVYIPLRMDESQRLISNRKLLGL